MSNFRGRSNAAQITRTFTWTMLLIVAITGISISLVVGYRLTRSRMQDAVTLEKSLNRSFIDDAPDWRQWKLNSPIDTHDTFVKVHTKLPGKKQEQFYSPHAKKFLAAQETTLPVFPAVRYRAGYGLYYRSGLEAKHIYYETWTSLNSVVHIFRLILMDLVFVLLFCSVLSYYIIRLLAKRLNQPLAHLTEAAKQINHAENVSYHEALPVPQSPVEVHDLGTEINDLLASLNQQVLRDHQFVSDASHELRTPLTSIQGHVSLIKRHGQQKPEIIPKSLDAIDHESHRMQALVESLLRLSRMDHTDLKLDYVTLQDVVTETVNDNQPGIPQAIHVVLPTQPTVAAVNVNSLRQILLALLSNASKYSPATTPITVTVTDEPTGPTLSVADLGMGVPADEKAHIFERFYRVDQARSQEIPGTGLGLAIVARLVELNHATITVTDNQPHGTVFTLQLATLLPND
ncbi:sensor histidine kinase [Levilactobacillus acidifarinae]|nr:HAMP domain-containing sensor histidine kinase [Levilactobacillus acidifarinae]GEO68179.1 two-component sensor histidine kinase [Levilactobacillus acidifarinae]